MPHILFKNDFKIDTPLFLPNGVSVDFSAKNDYETKFGITKNNLNFLLTKKTTENGYLLKYDKYTRISPVDHIKSTINEIAATLNQEILFSNTHINEKKVEPHKEYLKQIDYFVEEFDFNGEICIEIGFGSGRHILHQALNNPDILFIGLEIHSPSVEKMLKQVKMHEIKNILAINYDARLFLEFLQSNTISKIFVHFPVPWPKKPHRRVMSHEFVEESLRVLKTNGTLELRTDDEEYFLYSKDIAQTKNCEIEIFKNKDLEVTSKYETRWKQLEKNIFDLNIKCVSQSEQICNKYDFSFSDDIDFVSFKQNFQPITVVEDDFFVHFETLYTIDETSGLIQTSFGSKNKPEAKYILIDNNKLKYYQSNPISSKSNFKAHQKIMEILK